MSIILHTESPSSVDVIDGGSHKNIASKIAQTLKLDDVNIVGIDGPLGSGKSTVIKLLESELDEDEFQFINFDAEMYQQGSTKKALITKIYEGILPKITATLKDDLEKHKDDALGNNVSYKRTQDSEISIWAVLFLATLFFCSQSIRPLQLELSKAENVKSFFTITIMFAFLLSPAIVILSFLARSHWNKSLKIGNLIKKNTVDYVSEKMLISKEVGSIELHKAIKGFKDCIPPGMHFLLVIDNLDRISSEKVKEIWSDIELISSSSEKRFKLLIPYSSEHVAKSLSSDPYEGREFISKRIPISYQIPPILSAGWRNIFSSYWKTSFPSDTDSLYHDTSELIETWIPKECQPVTPRYLKKLVNDIQIIHSSTPFNVKHIICAYYILTTRQNKLSFDNLLIENFDDNSVDSQIQEKLKKSIRKLQRVYGSERKQWIDELLCINYQINAELAQGELIDEPLKIALRQGNPEELSRISNIFGFTSAWRRILDMTSPEDWFITLSKLVKEKQDLISEILPEAIKNLNTIETTYSEILENDNFLPAIDILKNSGYEIHGQYIKSLHILISDKIKEIEKLDIITLGDKGVYDSEIQHLLYHCNLLSKLIDKNIFKEAYPSPSAEFYLTNLRGKSEDYQYLQIDDYRIPPEDFLLGLQFAYLNNISMRLTEPDIDMHAMLDNPSIADLVKNNTSYGLEPVYNQFVNNGTTPTILSFELMFLVPQWHTSNLTSYYNRMFNSDIDWKSNCIAHAIAQMISSSTVTSIAINENNIVDKNDFHFALSCYLKYVIDFSKIIEALKSEHLNQHILSAIDILAEKQQLIINNTNAIIRNLFSVLEKYLSESTLDCLINSNIDKFIDSIESSYIKDIDQCLIDYIISHKSFDSLSTSLFNSLESELSSQDKFNAVATSPTESQFKIIKHAIECKFSFSVCREFIPTFFTALEIKKIDSNIPRLIFDTLAQDDKSSVLRYLSDIIYMRDIDLQRQIALLKHFNDIIEYNEDEMTSGSRSISRLFDNIDSNNFLASWLDNQNINFGKWNHDDKNAAILIIANNTSKFPKLSEKESVKNKKRELNSD